MLNRLSTWFNGGRSSTQQTSKLSTQQNGDNNSVVNIVVQGGDTVALPMRTTVWTETPQDLGSVAALLRWNTRLSPLQGRDAERAQLHAWADTEHPISIQLLHAPGGQGKTRLAAEFATGLQGWRHGWVDLADFSLAEALTWQGRCLLLVDYPEHQPGQLERLASAVERAAASPGQRLRILLVARDALAIQTALQQRPCAAWLQPPLALADLPDASGHALVQAALNRLSQLLGKSPVPLAPADVALWRARHPLHHSPLLATALAIHLARQPELHNHPDRWLNGTDLLARLVAHEARWWEKTAAGHGAPAGALTTVMAWATLSGSLTDQDINQTLAPDQGWSASDLQAIHAALRAVCRRAGEHGWAPVEPDLLAARFIDRWLADPARQGREAADGALARDLLHIDDHVAFDGHLNRLHMLAYDQTVRLGLRLVQNDGHRLERVVWTWAATQPTLRLALGAGLNQRARWPGLAGLAARVSHSLVESLAHEATEARRAQELNNLAVRLSETGDRMGALAVAQEAMTIYSRLAQVNSAAYEPDLAASLNNLGSRLSETGDRAGALMHTQEAVAMYRRLAQADPEAHEPDLAGSLNNLANRLSETGDWAGMLRLAKEAVSMYCHLAQANPACYEPDLAMSLNNLASCLSETGERVVALDQAQKAVSMYRRLAQANPAAYEPDLASSLNNLAKFLSENGSLPGALTSMQEAVVIRRRLAQANPAAYEAALAGSLTNLSNCLLAAGDRMGALIPAQEAASISHRLAKASPVAYEPALAASLNNLANCLSEAGDRMGSLVPAREAVGIYRRLAQANPAAYEPILATGLNNLASRLSETCDLKGGLGAAQEAVGIFRRLAQTNPAAYEPDLAISLSNLANRLSQTGDQSGALAPAQEAMGIRRRLAQTNSAAYEPGLAMSMNNLASFLSETGNRVSALALAREAVGIRRRLAQANPAAYEPDLAISLWTAMGCLVAADQRVAALEHGRESLRLFAQLAEREPARFEPYRLAVQAELDQLEQA